MSMQAIIQENYCFKKKVGRSLAPTLTLNTPYTYHICWSKLNVHYYGVRYSRACHPYDLWTIYFTSSKSVKDFRKQHGDPDIIEIRKTFTNKDDAGMWELQVLQRLNAANRIDWLNMHNGNNGNFKLDRASSRYKRKTKKELEFRREKLKQNRWWNNGIRQCFQKEPPDNSYKRGRLYFNNNGFKKGTEKQRGKIWIYNDKIEYMIDPKEGIPNGYKRGRLRSHLERWKTKHGQAKGTYHWNNGVKATMAHECPGPGWVRGRLKRKKELT